MKAFLLHEAQDFDFSAELPSNHEDLVQDLELETLFGAMANGDAFLFDIARRVVLTTLADPETIRYRQEVLADCLDHPDVIRQMYDIAVAALEDKRRNWWFSGTTTTSVLSGAVRQLEAFVVRLKALRQLADDNVEDVHSQGLRTLFRTLQRELDDEYFETIKYHLKVLAFRSGELISMELDRDNSGINYVLHASGPAKGTWKERLHLSPRRTYSFTLPPRDEAGANILSDMSSRGVNLVANAAAQSTDHVTSYFTMLRAELGFYVGCLNLHALLADRGVEPAMPAPVPWEERALSVEHLRDACLVLRSEQPVVGNDVTADGKSLVIITGANSGGKSTFLRSVGVAQLMLQCGLFVTATSYRASVRSAIFTHFIREEDETMSSGRLDEELSRMSTIANQIRPRTLMLFNESFAATNEREGSEIGRQVVRALLEAQIDVLFVTHQFDFADSFRRQPTDTTLFLRAPRRGGGGRTFRLEVAQPLPTSFGEDLYRRIGGWLAEDLADEVPVVGSAPGTGTARPS